MTHSQPSCARTLRPSPFSFFHSNDPSTTDLYTLSLHDALPIWWTHAGDELEALTLLKFGSSYNTFFRVVETDVVLRSEEHTSELQSRLHLVCRLLLEKKNHSRLCVSPNGTCASLYELLWM